jgi:hypothetical protein
MSRSPSFNKNPKTSSRAKNTDPGRRSSSMPPSINSLDHSIYSQGGSTTAIEYTDLRLQAVKLRPDPDLVTRIEELTREMGYLRLEIAFYRQCFYILHRFRQRLQGIYQKILLASYLPTNCEKLQEITTQLHRALEDSVKREAKAESEWKTFWVYRATRSSGKR